MLADIVARISYKPGWAFRIEEGRRQRLIITASVLHSQTLEPVVFAIKRLIPSAVTEETFASWVRDMTEEAEIHEMREFFRYDGVLLDDPHKEEK